MHKLHNECIWKLSRMHDLVILSNILVEHLLFNINFAALMRARKYTYS